MEPLSPLVRRLYLASFIVLFFAMLPAIIFYADGWRYKSGFGFVRTGGLYIGVPYPEADVYVNGEFVGQSGFLDRSFYLGDLSPSSYVVHVEREGYREWNRVLIVEERLVSDARALLLPERITPVRLLAATTTNSQFATTTRLISRADRDAYLDIFAATTTASTTIPVDEEDGVGLFIARGQLTARWIQSTAFPPSHFCMRPSSCVQEIVLEEVGVTTAQFFRGGVVYATRDGIVRFKEVDARETPVAATLFDIPNPDIRIIDDSLIIKSGTGLYEIAL